MTYRIEFTSNYEPVEIPSNDMYRRFERTMRTFTFSLWEDDVEVMRLTGDKVEMSGDGLDAVEAMVAKANDQRRQHTDYERDLANTYMLCWCGSPRAPRWTVSGSPPDVTFESGVECLWNGHP